MFIQSCLSLCECNVQILILCNDHKLFPYIQIEAAEWQINFFFFLHNIGVIFQISFFFSFYFNRVARLNYILKDQHC